MSFKLSDGALAEISGHVAVGLGSGAVVFFRDGQGVDQLLCGPLAVRAGQSGGQGTGSQSIGQFQRTDTHTRVRFGGTGGRGASSFCPITEFIKI